MVRERVVISGRSWRSGPRSELYTITLDAFRAALRASDPSRLVRDSVKLKGEILSVRRLRIDLGRYDRVFVLGGGKATGGMAEEVEKILGDRITGGAVNVPDSLPMPKLHRVRPHPATHPFPSHKGVEGVLQMFRLAEKSTPKDLFLCLFSGGGSALMPAPADGVTLEDKVATTDLLLKSGAVIGEMNIVRRHLSTFKGGRLAQKLEGAEVVSLVISDVPGDRFDTVSSGPTAPDSTTFAQARGVLEKYRIWHRVPASVRGFITKGARGDFSDTPKPGSSVFRRVRNILIGSNRDARLAACAYLKAKGIPTSLHKGFYQGEATRVGVSLAKELLNGKGPRALVAGGETTVVVKGKGRGGRDQELVLSAARSLKGHGAATFAALATDGVDGPTDAAGAIADDSSVGRGLKLGLDPDETIESNDSYNYFSKVGGLLMTGPTGTNVNDIVVAVAIPEKD